MANPKQKQTVWRLDADLKAKLVAEAKAQERSLSWLLNYIIKQYFEAKR